MIFGLTTFAVTAMVRQCRSPSISADAAGEHPLAGARSPRSGSGGEGGLSNS
jgi:hypothetical protein